MGSPVSAVVANLCMEVIEEEAIKRTPVPPKQWKRFVDDSFCITKRTAVATFHETLNSIDPHIMFTIEEEDNGRIAFLDTLVSRQNNTLNIDVYRKPTHTNPYLDYTSHHDKRHKISAARTLIHRARTIPSHEEGRTQELNLVNATLKANGYPKRMIKEIAEKQSRQVTPDPEVLVGMFFRWADPASANRRYAVLPYIEGVTEALSRTLRKHDIDVYNKPLTTLENEFRSPKYRHPINEQPNVIYKIPCKDCNWSYIGETGRSFTTRKKEHIRNVKNYTKGSNIANHAWSNDHIIDFDNRQGKLSKPKNSRVLAYCLD